MGSREGGCACGTVRFRLTDDPIVVHCCHCRSCQRESGSAFALNAVIEADNLELVSGAPERIDTPSDSGKGQAVFRCPVCKVALWSHYAGVGAKADFIRVGALDDPDAPKPPEAAPARTAAAASEPQGEPIPDSGPTAANPGEPETAALPPPHDDHADLQLQPDHAPERDSAGRGAG